MSESHGYRLNAIRQFSVLSGKDGFYRVFVKRDNQIERKYTVSQNSAAWDMLRDLQLSDEVSCYTDLSVYLYIEYNRNT